MADTDNKVEFEFALKDAMSPILKSIQDSVESVHRTLVKSAEAGTSSTNKITQQTRQMEEQSKRTIPAITNVGNMLGGIGSRLLGPGAVVYGFYEAAKSLDKFAVAQMNVKNLAMDARFTAQQIADVRLMYQRHGQTAEAADAMLTRVSKVFDEVRVKGTTGPIMQQYLRYNREGALEVVRLVQTGQRWEALKIILNDYLANPELGRYRAQVELLFGIETGTFHILNDNLENTPRYWLPPEVVGDKIAEYHAMLEKIAAIYDRISSSVLARAMAALELDPEKRKQFFDAIRKEEGSVERAPLPSGPGMFPSELLPKWLGGTKDLQETKEDSKETTIDIRNILRHMEDVQKGAKAPTPRQTGGEVYPDQSYLVGEKGAEVFSSGGKYQMVGEGGPEVIKPSTGGQVLTELQAFAKGGLYGVMKSRGVETPGWMDKMAGFFQDPNVTTAMGMAAPIPSSAMHRFMHGVGGSAVEFAQEHFGGGGQAHAGEASDLFAGSKYALEGEGGERAAANWEALNKRLVELSDKSNPMTEVELGYPEGGFVTGGGMSGDFGGGGRSRGMSLFGQPLHEELKAEEKAFEKGEGKEPWGGPGGYEFYQEHKHEYQQRHGRYLLDPIGLDRDRLDRELGGRGRPSLNGEISFENVPPGVKVDTEDDGFDKFTKRVTKQQPDMAI